MPPNRAVPDEVQPAAVAAAAVPSGAPSGKLARTAAVKRRRQVSRTMPTPRRRGLLVAGALIGRIGFHATATLYAGFGLACTLLIGVRWRRALWPEEAPANMR